MMKFGFKMLALIVILISTNIYAKSDKYYDLETKECQIAIPVSYKILDGFTKKRIAFLHNKSLLDIKTIILIKEDQRKYVNWLKEKFKQNDNVLIEEKKIGHLLYQKFKFYLTKNAFQYKYNIFGKNFFISSTNVEQKDIDHMIKHCNETYNEESNTSK